jgi:exosortase
VLWARRDWFPEKEVGPSWLGVPVLVLAGACRLAGSIYSFEWLEGGAILLALAGCCLITLGYPVLRWALPAFVLLVFILPWPWQVDLLLTQPLRRFATLCSTFALQVLGMPALARGNIIVINELEVGVVEACSGLGMLMTFFALSTAVAFSVRRPRFDKVVLFLSAVPIGVMMNVARITVTVFLFQYASAEVAKVVFHDVAGWVMMPAALAVLWLELVILGWLWLPEEKSRPVPLPRRAVSAAAPPPSSRMADTRPVGEFKPLEVSPDQPLQEMPDAAS